MDDAALRAHLEALPLADQRLARTVDEMSAAHWHGASVLPRWSRAHVVAHLALNADALAGALEGLVVGQVVPMYPSNAARDADIDSLASADIAEIRDRLAVATTRFRDATATVTAAGAWHGAVHRLPEGPAWPAASVPQARRREIEIHHADLDAGYGHRDWPEDFAVDLLETAVEDHLAGSSEAFSIRASDIGHRWSLGADGPIVEGTAADLGWWLVGRGGGVGLHVPGGELPQLGPWQRAPGK